MNDTRQVQQAERRKEWEKEGHLEWPTQIATMLKPEQQPRLAWLKERVEGTILEAGCSWGYVLAYVGGHYGVDINPDSIRIARELNRRADFFVWNALNLPFLDGQFDTVMLPDILEHLPYHSIPVALAQARRVARKQVLVTVPNGDLDTEEAFTAKHQWLPTRDLLRQAFPSSEIESIGIFYGIQERQDGG